MNEEKKVTRSKKATNMRKAISMVLVTVLLMSSATYAWFTLNSNAKVSNLTMKASDEGGGLLISEKADTGFGEEVTLTVPTDLTLLPATVKKTIDYDATDAKQVKVYKPVYENAQVKSIGDLETNDEVFAAGGTVSTDKKYYAYKKVVYLKATSTTKNVVYLEKTNSKILDKDDNTTKDYSPSSSVRIALTATYKEAVEEDETNHTVVLASDKTSAKAGTSAEYLGDKATIEGSYGGPSTIDFATGTLAADTSIFTAFPTQTAVPVTVVVWFEGTDDDCENEIMAQSIISNLSFVAKTA